MRNEPGSLVTGVVVIVALKIFIVRTTVGFGLVNEIELEWVQPDDDEPRAAFVTSDAIALFGFGIYKNVFAAFWADRCWHLSKVSGNLEGVICVSLK